MIAEVVVSLRAHSLLMHKVFPAKTKTHGASNGEANVSTNQLLQQPLRILAHRAAK
jgi:hypothetical protein